MKRCTPLSAVRSRLNAVPLISTHPLRHFPSSSIVTAPPPPRSSSPLDIFCKPLLCSRAHRSTAAPSPPSVEAHRPSHGAAQKWAAQLPDISYGFPRQSTVTAATTTTSAAAAAAAASPSSASSHPYAAEQSGGLQKEWLQRLPRAIAASRVHVERYLPTKTELWQSPPYEALREIVLQTPYHDALKIIMEHDYTFLFPDVMCNSEAPMPHVVYEDFMKALTFSSRQRPPEEQFALPEEVLRDLLCWAAYYCTVDPFYFTSASLFFKKMEQEQHISPALHSAWVYVCTAAGQLDAALAYAVYMEQHDIAFDPAVFALMLHPSLSPVQLRLQHAPQTAKGLVLQRRLCHDMQQHHGTTAVAVHAMFVYHMLTLRHARKWEVLRSAAEMQNNARAAKAKAAAAVTPRQASLSFSLQRPSGFTAVPSVHSDATPAEFVCSRTMQLALAVFSQEKGVRWGPRTARAMVSLMLSAEEVGSTMADVLFVLMRIRRNEKTPALAELPRTAFTEEEQVSLMQAAYRRSRADPAYAVAAPLLRELLAAGDDDETPVAHGEKQQANGTHQGETALQKPGSDAGILRALHELQRLSKSLDEPAVGTMPPASSSSYSSPSSSLSSSADRSFDNARGGELAYSTSESLHQEQQTPAVVARELLEAVMALDRASVQHNTAGSSSTSSATTVDATEGAALADQVADSRATLTALGASVSLSRWSAQQVEREAEETRLRAQVNTAWIAPFYRP